MPSAVKTWRPNHCTVREVLKLRCITTLGLDEVWEAGWGWVGLPLTTLSLCPPTDETLYEAPEPIFTSNNSCSGLGSCQLFLSTVPVLWTLLGS